MSVLVLVRALASTSVRPSTIAMAVVPSLYLLHTHC